MSNNQSHISIRKATSADAEALERLAQLDSERVPAAPVLLAETADGPLAAISIVTGATVSDPFRPTADVVETLRLQAGFETPATRSSGTLSRLWGRSQRPAGPRPSSPSVPGFPVLPGQTH